MYPETYRACGRLCFGLANSLPPSSRNSIKLFLGGNNYPSPCQSMWLFQLWSQWLVWRQAWGSPGESQSQDAAELLGRESSPSTGNAGWQDGSLEWLVSDFPIVQERIKPAWKKVAPRGQDIQTHICVSAGPSCAWSKDYSWVFHYGRW